MMSDVLVKSECLCGATNDDNDHTHNDQNQINVNLSTSCLVVEIPDMEIVEGDIIFVPADVG